MSRRTKIIIAAVILLLLLLLGALLFLQPRGGNPAEPEPVGGRPAPTNGTALPVNFSSGSFNTNISAPVNQPAPVEPKKPDDRATIKTIAKTFAEMYGSFSTEGNYQNIIDAEYYMTDAFKARSDVFVADARSKPRTGEFAGTTTRAIFEPKVTSFDATAGTAAVTLDTQRRETGSTAGGSGVYYQVLDLTFIKIGDTWKIDSATWVSH